tara:strand:+ start:911 stop:1108 length:198 start_codon:yes stop_codon:yes gene_type:complete
MVSVEPLAIVILLFKQFPAISFIVKTKPLLTEEAGGRLTVIVEEVELTPITRSLAFAVVFAETSL